MAPSVPGTIGTPADSASSRALTLLPIRVMAWVDGPMNVMPEAWQSSANSAFSDRNPYPGWMASAPIRLAKSTICLLSKKPFTGPGPTR